MIARRSSSLHARSTHVRTHVQGVPLSLGDSLITPSSYARIVGVIFDAEMQSHIKKVCPSAYIHLRNIASIRSALTDKAAECLIHAFISSRLNCCNSLYTGLPLSSLDKLQNIQNARIYIHIQNM